MTALKQDSLHKRMYKESLAYAGYEGAPEWEDLSDEQRESIRNINLEHINYMDKLGAAIANGTPLPDVF